MKHYFVYLIIVVWIIALLTLYPTLKAVIQDIPRAWQSLVTVLYFINIAVMLAFGLVYFKRSMED